MIGDQAPDRGATKQAWIVLPICGALVLAIVILIATVIAEPLERLMADLMREPTSSSAPMPTLRRAPREFVLAPGGQAASAIGDEAEWITSDDYPVDSIRAEEQGRVRIRWIIGTDGRARDCGVVESSGHPRLDAAACEAIMRRARYSPARDAAGTIVASTKTRRVKWVLPTL